MRTLAVLLNFFRAIHMHSPRYEYAYSAYAQFAVSIIFKHKMPVGLASIHYPLYFKNASHLTYYNFGTRDAIV